MKKFRFWYRYVVSFVLRFKLILGIGILIGFFVFIFLGYVFPSATQQTERVGLVGRHNVDNLPENVLSLASKGLTYVDENGDVKPALAQSWAADSEGKVWTFLLKDDIYWQDGTLILSSDIDYHFSDVTTERPDEKTIVFKLKDPYSPFPVVVSRPIFKKGLLGSGDWSVKKITQKNGYVEQVQLRDRDENKKNINFYPSEDDAKIAFKLGQIDVLLDLLDPHPFDSWDTADLVGNVNDNRYVAIFFNHEDELAANKSLRQALAYGLDKDSVSANRAYGPISPRSWAYNPQVKKYEYNLDRAAELLDEIPSEEHENLHIKLATIPVLLPVAEQVANHWRELGLTVTVQVASIVPEDYQAFMAIFDIPNDPDQYPLWHSTQIESNIANYSNLRIDKLLVSGRTELKKEERRKVYLDFQRFLLEDVPAVFLYHPVYYTVIRK